MRTNEASVVPNEKSMLRQHQSHRKRQRSKERPMRLSVTDSCTVDARVADHGSNVAVLVTHPWGLLGGDMRNNVVAFVCRYFQRLGVTTMRFNFPGTQVSRGHQETATVIAAASFLLEGRHAEEEVRLTGSENDDDDDNDEAKGSASPTEIVLVGYSYGSIVAGSASASIPKCVAVVYVGCPVSVQTFLVLFNDGYHLRRSKSSRSIPRLFVHGTNDNFTSTNVLSKWVRKHFPDSDTTRSDTVILRNADHFFFGREDEIVAAIGDWMVATFPSLNGDIGVLASASLR